MNIVVLGGEGFVGKALTQSLGKTDHEVIGLSRRTGCDLLDFDSIRNRLQQCNPTIIYNCAAHVGSVHYVTSYAANVFNDNVMMALNLYRAIAEVCPQATVINPLSNCSYPGQADIHVEDEWWNGMVHDSVFSYGNAKRMVYVTAVCYAQQYRIRTMNFLVPNTFGPGDYLDPNKVHALNGMIIRMIKAQKAGQDVFEIWGTGKPVREWAYIGDVAAILSSALTYEGDMLEPINIGQNNGYTIGESAQMIAEAIGYVGELWFNHDYQDGAPRKILSDTRFRKHFPDFVFFDHRQGIVNTANYYKSLM